MANQLEYFYEHQSGTMMCKYVTHWSGGVLFNIMHAAFSWPCNLLLWSLYFIMAKVSLYVTYVHSRKCIGDGTF